MPLTDTGREAEGRGVDGRGVGQEVLKCKDIQTSREREGCM